MRYPRRSQPRGSLPTVRRRRWIATATAAGTPWTQDINDEINGIAQQLGLEPYKRYRIYEKSLL